jgi:hypothetical protein
VDTTKRSSPWKEFDRFTDKFNYETNSFLTNMTPIAAYSQEQADQVQGCHSCPLARHLDGHRFACADRVYATDSRHPATAECREAIVESGHKYFQPLPIPDLQGLNTEMVCEYVGLAVNWLDPDEDQTPEGHDLIEVKFAGHKVGAINKIGEWYSCNRITGVSFTDPHYLALHLIHPDYLYRISEEIIAGQEKIESEIAAKGKGQKGILSDQAICEYM